MDLWTIVVAIATIIGIVASVVIVLDYVEQQRKRKRKQAEQTSPAPASALAAAPPAASNAASTPLPAAPAPQVNGGQVVAAEVDAPPDAEADGPPSPARPIIRTPDQRLRVFVSSTLQELADERAAARDAIAHLRLSPVLFELGARPHPPRDLYRAYLEQSDIFVGIYWQRYGWTAPDMDISGLEDEYRLSGNRPKLIYIKEPAKREPDLEALLAQIRNDDHASYKPFRTAAELRELIENDLAVLLTERFTAGALPAAPEETSDSRRDNLPAPPTPIVGRQKEVAAVRELLLREDVHLVTLSGPGGIGKSRLALEVAAGVRDQFKDGVCFVALASITDPALVVSTIAHSLGLQEIESERRPLLRSLQGYLRDRCLLLLLDNFEQVVGAAPVVGDLLQAAPDLKVLVTSRAILHVRGEHEFAVPPLALPDLEHLPAGGSDLVAALSQYEAVRLFIERAQATRPDFAVTTENAAAVAEICYRLDGLPLAIELAAARIKLLSPEAMLQRLSNRLELLTAGARDLPARQQTLRNAIDWSYSLLDSKEQTLFTRLAVFVRGCTLEAIESVCSTPAVPAGDLDVLEQLQSLVDKSLVQEQGQDSGEPRFVMLEIIRDYALERLEANGEAEQMQRQHAAYYLALAERTAPELKGPRQSLWVARLEQEHDNLRAVLRWSLDRGEVETAARLGWAVWVFWWIHGHLSEGQRWMEEALARGNTLPARLRARAFCAAGGMAYLQGDYERAVSLCEACVALFPEVGDKGVKAYALHTLGHVTMGRRDYERAHIFLDESVQLFRELGDKWGESFGRAGLGRLALAQGDVERAIPLLEETLALGRELGNRFVIAWALAHLGHAALAQNDYERATPLFEESLELGHQLGDKMNVAECLDGLAGVAGAQASDPEAALRAARLFGAAEALRDAIGATRPPFLQSHCERIAVTVAIQLGEDASAAWAEGRAIAMEQAITYALNRGSS